MIAIDFHIHTVPSPQKNENFIFSLDRLKEYVQNRQLDAIAITNHNLFDKNNFNQIKNELSIKVFPGIEIDFENGHMLIIANDSDVVFFDQLCSKISSFINVNTYLTINELNSILFDKSSFLFIPHYKKRPAVSYEVINALKHSVFCGEVDNQSKFIRLYKEENDLTPVLFSDWRATQESELPFRLSFLDVDSVDFNRIKEALRDKEKVYIDKEKSRSTFSILEDGTKASVGLNVVVGKRSSGKSYTLNSIYKNFNNGNINKSIKYIRQFELIERDSEEKEEEKFNSILANKSSIFIQEYLDEFKTIVDRIQTFDIEGEESTADNYLVSLLEFANNVEKHDSFSRVPLFREQLFEIEVIDDLETLILNVESILENSTYQNLIEKHIRKENLVSLLVELISVYGEKNLHNLAIQNANLIIDAVKNSLTVVSNQNAVLSFNIVDYARKLYDVSLFETLVASLKKPFIINKKECGKFKIVAEKTPINNASELQKIFRSKAAFSPHYLNYNKPYNYLISLKQSNIVPVDQLYRCFVKVDYFVLNQNGLHVSGGERAEYNLEEKLHDADEYEMLLIDEPESSFDNIFLKEHINAKIKNLSKRMPVFVSTHNNVLGASLKADYILYTEKSLGTNNENIFKLYGGRISDKELVTSSGDSIKNHLVQLDCFEGGEDSYIDRSMSYENIKD